MLNLHFILPIILMFGAFLALFAALIIYKVNFGNLKANKWLSLFCIATAGHLTRGVFLYGDYYLRFPIPTESIDNLRYFLGPSVYFYVKVLIDPDTRLRKRDLLHLGPLVLNLLAQMPFYLKTPEYQVQFLFDWLNTPVLQTKFLLNALSRLVFIISFGYYLIASIRLYKSTADRVKASVVFGDIYLSWVRVFTFAMSLGVFFSFLCMLTPLVRRPLYYPYYFLLLFIVSVVCYCFLRALQRPEILYMARPVKSDTKHYGSHLTPEDMALYFEKSKALMERDQVYLDPDLNLSVLAQTMAISRNDLSQIINEKTGKSFHDFINYYRVEKVKELMKDPAKSDQTILDLAFEAGFNSKAPFNNAFKKHTGESPIAWRKKHQK